MFGRLRDFLLPLLRIPPEPAPPWGAPGSVRVFRAGRNFFRLRLLRWGIGQIATAFGIAFSLMFLAQLKQDVAAYQEEPRAAIAQPAGEPAADSTTTPRQSKRSFIARHGLPEPGALPPELQAPIRHLAQRNPWWLFPALTVFEFLGVVIYLAQLPITYALVRLEYEQRWYIVTDRSLRIRSGIVSLRESTMSFANLQQVTVSQGPVQRLLSIADVQVRSAGGGSGDAHEKGQSGDSMHVGVFHGVENAMEIRDLILERLRQYRAAGLGDPDDHRESSSPQMEASGGATLVAARELLAEARMLHAVCQSRRRSAE
jgi:hypothetical protein